jgi:alpha-N-acetylglucosamine transferase
MSKKTYLTALSTDSFIMGVLVLSESLKSVGAKYPLHCLVTDDLTTVTYKALEKAGVTYTKIKPVYKIDESVKVANIEQSCKNWTYTFFKLYMLGATAYEKVVYLDADTVIIQNIDELFDKPHLTACKDKELYPPPLWGYDNLNSGVIVVEPNENDMLKAIQLTNEHRGLGGDQQIFEKLYPDWTSNTELKLPKQFNVFGATYWVDYCFRDVSIRGENAVKVLHFVGLKPWVDIGEKNRWTDVQIALSTRTFERQRYVYCLQKYREYETAVNNFLTQEKLIVQTKQG